MSTEPSKQVRPQLELKPSPLLVDDRPFDTGKRPITTLTDDMLTLAQLLIYGLDEPDVIEGKEVKAHWPLTMRQAAKWIGGMRVSHARYIASSPVFIAEQERLLKERRNNEKARNLSTAVIIRDDEGQGLAADKTVRLKAISVIEGVDGKGVSLTINNNNGGQQVVNPGYVIKLMADPAKAQEPQKPMITIEGTATREGEQ